MIEATQRTITGNWAELRPFVELESRHILDSVRTIAELRAAGSLEIAQADLQMAIQKETYAALLVTIHGIRKIQAENAVNAGISVIRGTVNRVLGWSLL